MAGTASNRERNEQRHSLLDPRYHNGSDIRRAGPLVPIRALPAGFHVMSWGLTERQRACAVWRLLDHLVGAQQDRGGYVEAERLVPSPARVPQRERAQ